jgi:hypothetical protein
LDIFLSKTLLLPSPVLTIDAAHSNRSDVNRKIPSNVKFNFNFYQTGADGNGSHGAPNANAPGNTATIIGQKDLTGKMYTINGLSQTISHGNAPTCTAPIARALISYVLKN